MATEESLAGVLQIPRKFYSCMAGCTLGYRTWRLAVGAIAAGAIVAVFISYLSTSWTKGDQALVLECSAAGKINTERFNLVMQTVAEGWNRGDARLAASCFAEDAVYSGPPSPGHRGRKALYEYFGGASGRDLPMHMTWHNLVFDSAQQIGVGEYTFRYQIQTHGLVIVKVSDGLIRNWREYEVESNVPWGQFIGDNKF